MTADKNEQTSAVKRTRPRGLARTLWVHNGRCLFTRYKFDAAIKKAKRYGCTYIVGEIDYLDYATRNNVYNCMWMKDTYEIDVIDDHRNLKILWRLKL